MISTSTIQMIFISSNQGYLILKGQQSSLACIYQPTFLSSELTIESHLTNHLRHVASRFNLLKRLANFRLLNTYVLAMSNSLFLGRNLLTISCLDKNTHPELRGYKSHQQCLRRRFLYLLDNQGLSSSNMGRLLAQGFS